MTPQFPALNRGMWRWLEDLVRTYVELIRQPSFRQTARGTPICSFGLRVDASDREHACVIRIVIFGKQAEPAARHLGEAANWRRRLTDPASMLSKRNRDTRSLNTITGIVVASDVQPTSVAGDCQTNRPKVQVSDDCLIR